MTLLEWLQQGSANGAKLPELVAPAIDDDPGSRTVSGMTSTRVPYVFLPAAVTISLQLGGSLQYLPACLRPSEADALLDEVGTLAKCEQETIVLFGKPVLQPRLTAWFERRYTASSGYRDSLPAPAIGPHLTMALHIVDSLTNWRPNAILVNHYPDGQSAVGWHADDEPGLGPDPLIASISLGAPRDFLVKPKDATHDGERYRFSLRQGDLLLMRSCQHAYQHCVPRRTHAGERFNLTARSYLG